jgi:hypothetical protein
MKNSRHPSCYKPGHGSKHPIKVCVAQGARGVWFGSVCEKRTARALYSTGPCGSDTEAHAVLQGWLRAQGYHKTKRAEGA